MRRGPGLRKALAVAVLAAAAVVTTGTAASALEEPRVPEDVGRYFATGLVSRLADLFGPKAGAEVIFDSAAKVGDIRRVRSWTKTYLSGTKTSEPTQLTNTWIAPITAADGTTLTPLVSGSSGVAAVTTPAAYQRQFSLVAPASVESAPNRGLLLAVLVLGVVVVLLAVFVLLPDRRRPATAKPAAKKSP